MISAIRRYVLNDSDKNVSSPHIFVILCVYTIIVTAYTGLFFSLQAAAIRLGLSAVLVAAYVAVERSPRADSSLTAFLSPLLIIGLLTAGALYFNGDFLLFIYNTAMAMISLTYLKPKSLAAYVTVSSAAFGILLFVFRVNLLGPVFTPVYNALFYTVSVGLNILVYIFCKSYESALQMMREAKDEANRAARAKGDFLANMSHEIRTPLNAVIGLTEAELRRELPKADLDNIRKIYMSGKLLIGIINDILDMSKIEAGRFDLVPAPYDFADMIYDVASLNMVRIGSKPIRFVVAVDGNIPRRMVGDALRVRQLLNNLLSNAFKYTKEGSVELRATLLAGDGRARLRFSVTDTGVGIREADLKKLFSEYAQVNQQSKRGIEGTGLGLAISKGLAELMGGSIAVKSEFGAGSAFTTEIEQAIEDGTPIGAETAAALGDFSYRPVYTESDIEYIPMPHVRVLVVDDVAINLEVAAACLEPYQVKTDCVDNGAEAIERIRAGEPHYNLIFMDHMMPDMDGIAATRAIRDIGTPYAHSVPIVALTANALAGNEKIFAENGFQGFMSKPIDLRQLDVILREWAY